ncbi:right-handed parallel beta-helix repeat-containing protein [candidate division KSB1 bacterium]|nr:right-handed parallel beta-helix repeat-containing protein [candidate division KSB1 bacterium]
MRLSGMFLKIKINKLVLLLAFFSLANGVALSATYYVSTSGSDSNRGSFSAPFRTIQVAANSTSPGDTVMVRAGYYDRFRIFPAEGYGSSGTAGNPIVFKSYGDGKVTIDGGASAAIWIEGAYLVFDGFTLTAPQKSGVWGGIGVFLCNRDSNAGSKTMTTHHVKIANCEIVDCLNQGFLGGCDDCEFTHLDVHHNGREWFTDQGFYLTGSRNRITYSKIHDNAGTGIQLWNTDYDAVDCPNNFVIANNEIYANGFTVVTDDAAHPEHSQYGHGIVLGSNDGMSENNVIKNNFIYANFPNGIFLYSNSNNTRILNNTIVANINAINLDQAAQKVVFSNNLVYANTSSAVQQWLAANRPDIASSVDASRHGSGASIATSQSSNLDGHTFNYNLYDPNFRASWKNVTYNSFQNYTSSTGNDAQSISENIEFANYNQNDFSLLSPSAAIDRGQTISDVTVDFYNTPRPQDNGYDIGAFEYTSGDNSLRMNSSANVVSGSVPLTVNFSCNVTGGSIPYYYQWNFGDNSTSNSQNPQHVFTQVGSYNVALTVTDSENNQVDDSITITVSEVILEYPEFSDIKITEPETATELNSIESDSWYDLYLFPVDPQGWDNLSYADVWLSHSSYTEGTIENRGGTFYAATNYVISYSIEDGTIWAEETEGTSTWSDVTGRLGIYVDDDANEYQQNITGGWIKARFKLLPQAQTGTWHINAYVLDKNSHSSVLFTKNITVVEKSVQLAASLSTARVKNGDVEMYTISLNTTKPVTQIPSKLSYIASDNSEFDIELTGGVPGTQFSGELLYNADIIEGLGHFILSENALKDSDGNNSNLIKTGATLRVDWSPQKPQNVTITVIE